MEKSNNFDIQHIFQNGRTLNKGLGILHDRILASFPYLDRIAVAIYDAPEDQLKTFINSTRKGEPLTAYEFKLSESPSLLGLAKSGQPRVINEIQDTIQPTTPHSQWLRAQGYRSSLTLPIYDNGQFLGFVFFDSLMPSAFSLEIQRDLSLYASLINMSISNEFSALRALVASVALARDFALLRDFETGAHLVRVASYSRIIAKGVAAKYRLTDEFVEQLYLYAPLHDIGKIGIPDPILLKTERLDAEERRIMESHVPKGCEIANKILGDFALKQLPEFQIMTNIVNDHHELLDGSGYPKGLRAGEISIEARIVTVADIFDALTSKRPYKKAWRIQEAFAELESMAVAVKIDADCVAALVRQSDEINEIMTNYREQDNGP